MRGIALSCMGSTIQVFSITGRAKLFPHVTCVSVNVEMRAKLYLFLQVLCTTFCREECRSPKSLDSFSSNRFNVKQMASKVNRNRFGKRFVPGPPQSVSILFLGGRFGATWQISAAIWGPAGFRRGPKIVTFGHQLRK